jgi:hypothetical protein
MKLIQQHLSDIDGKINTAERTIFTRKLKNTDKIDICTYIFAKYKWIENDLEKDVLL